MLFLEKKKQQTNHRCNHVWRWFLYSHRQNWQRTLKEEEVNTMEMMDRAQVERVQAKLDTIFGQLENMSQSEQDSGADDNVVKHQALVFSFFLSDLQANRIRVHGQELHEMLHLVDGFCDLVKSDLSSESVEVIQ
jgi:coproporphyrinogen III oxidase